MLKLNYVMGMLAAGGAVAATGAEANVTYTLNLPITGDASTTPITLLGAFVPQYAYGSFANLPGNNFPYAGDAGLISTGPFIPPPVKTDLGLVAGYTVGGQPLTEAEWKQAGQSNTLPLSGQEPIAEAETGVDSSSPPGGTDHYAYLLFDTTLDGPVYFGYAHIGADNTLETITVDVPEPQTWALLLAGVGLAGGALRRSRRGRAAVAA